MEESPPAFRSPRAKPMSVSRVGALLQHVQRLLGNRRQAGPDARLPDKYRAPLLLCYFEGLTQEEAAHRLGWSKRAVKDRLERGRNRLRRQLARRGLSLSAALTGTMLAPGASGAAAPAALAEATQ